MTLQQGTSIEVRILYIMGGKGARFKKIDALRLDYS
jgi:hypothetical protein